MQEHNHATEEVWVLADDRPGNFNQAIGIAEALGKPYTIKKVRYNRYAKLPNILRQGKWLGIDTVQSDALTPPWPALVLSAGRKTAPVACHIKRSSGGATRIVQIMGPGYPFAPYDMVVLPQHDNGKPSSQCFITIGAPNKITPSLLAAAKKEWQEKFVNLPEYKIALLIGGSTRHAPFTPSHALQFAREANALLADKQGAFLISTSRRTDEAVKETLIGALEHPFYFYDYTVEEKNPYFGYLALAECIVVTGDSISMCSEACSTGKPVYIFAPPEMVPSKYKAFHQSLYKGGYAKPLTGDKTFWQYTPLAEAQVVAQAIKERLGI